MPASSLFYLSFFANLLMIDQKSGDGELEQFGSEVSTKLEILAGDINDLKDYVHLNTRSVQ